jgi:hypothetical protein
MLSAVDHCPVLLRPGKMILISPLTCILHLVLAAIDDVSDTQ